MIRKRLIQAVPNAKRYIAGNVLLQWCGLIANIVLMLLVADMLQALYEGAADGKAAVLAVAAAVMIGIRFLCTRLQAKMSFLASKTVKKTLRGAIYQKLLRLGPGYSASVPSAEVVQGTVEGVEQLESYFGAYLPQLFYSMLAPLTLFAVLVRISLLAAVALLVCVPLIPVTIAAVQTIAKKMLSSHWTRYTDLGDVFLENLQGLTTLKIYQADGYKHAEMNQKAEAFRRVTMQVLKMQLHSITLMDLIAYGGAALGIIIAALQFRAGAISLGGSLAILLLSAEFFIPMRRLGSFFHVAMSGMAASDTLFRLLDLPEETANRAEKCPVPGVIACQNLRYAYADGQEVLHGVSIGLPRQGMAAVVGESGCGKSTLAKILSVQLDGYTGRFTLDGIDAAMIDKNSLHRHISYVGFNSYLFKGSVRDTLRMGNPQAEDAALWNALERVNLAAFLRTEAGLDTMLAEQGSNLSGGQRQRLALARALVHDSAVYIFDEITSSIDMESEQVILTQILALAREKAVLMITHRLANVHSAQCIYVMQDGRFTERGTHAQLLQADGLYAALWETQYALETYGKEAVQ